MDAWPPCLMKATPGGANSFHRDPGGIPGMPFAGEPLQASTVPPPYLTALRGFPIWYQEAWNGWDPQEKPTGGSAGG